MEITAEIRTLAKFTAGPLPVISVYLNTQWRDQHQRARTTTFFAQHLHQARALELETDAARQSLARDLERLTQWGQQHLQSPGATTLPGVALFACAGADLWVEFPSPLPFEDEWTIDDRPIVRQLAHLDEDYTHALLVLIDSRTARVYEVVLGGFLAETDFASEVPGRHKQGGWAQARYQRHVQEHIDRHYKEVAAYVAAYMESHPHTRLILSGQHDIVAGFRQWLPSSVQAQSLETVSLDMHDDRHRILEVAQDALQRHEREEEQATVQLLVNRAGHGGLAVLGQQATLAAVNTVRVHKLVMQRDVRRPGWRCRSCAALTAETHLQCVLCGGEVTTVELGEAMIQAVLQADGLVELIAPDSRLTAYEGIGALLRYQ
ncbi:MAG TPA: Vms1/Ankzf1 family peptidyl-tRNA hydrolase [Candidatus Tectomicrobia bacterium]